MSRQIKQLNADFVVAKNADILNLNRIKYDIDTYTTNSSSAIATKQLTVRDSGKTIVVTKGTGKITINLPSVNNNTITKEEIVGFNVKIVLGNNIDSGTTDIVAQTGDTINYVGFAHDGGSPDTCTNSTITMSFTTTPAIKGAWVDFICYRVNSSNNNAAWVVRSGLST